MSKLTDIGKSNQRFRFVVCLLFALLATSISLSIATYAGWQRGGVAVERVMNVTLGGISVLCAHLLPVGFSLLRVPTRICAVALWGVSVFVVLYGQLTFFLVSNQHAGDLRASTSTVVIVPHETGSPGRALTEIAQDVAKVSGDLAIANARRCTDECPTSLKVRRTILAAKLAALDTEAGEAKRRENAEDRRNEQIDRNETLRATLRADPVALAVASRLGTTEHGVELTLAVACAVVLEGAATIGWLFVLVASSRASSRELCAPSREATAPKFEAVARNPATAAGENPCIPATSEHDLHLRKLHEAVMEGKLNPTQQEIRKFFRCGQRKAGRLNRQYAARFGSIRSQADSIGSIIDETLSRARMPQESVPLA